MLSIENTLVSDELFSENFVCNISKCKGECCVAGEAGAPLEKKETTYLEKNFLKIKPFLNTKGIKSILDQGAFVKGADGDFETPLVDGEECAYTVFSESGIANSEQLLSLTKKKIKKTFEVNTLSHFWTWQEFLPSMLEDNHGHIVTISSCLGRFSW